MLFWVTESCLRGSQKGCEICRCGHKECSARKEMPASYRHMHEPICDSKFMAPERLESSQGSGVMCAVTLSEIWQHGARIHLCSWNWRQLTFTPAETHHMHGYLLPETPKTPI